MTRSAGSPRASVVALREANAGRPIRIGFYSPFFGSTYGGGEKYLGVAAEALRDALPAAAVEILSPSRADVHRYEERLGLDLHGIGTRSTVGGPPQVARRLARVRALRRWRDLAVSARTRGLTADYDLFFSMVYVLPAFTRARRSVILCQFPYELCRQPAPGPAAVVKRLGHFADGQLRRRLLGRGLDDFQLVVCQSKYVQGWVARRWGRASLVVNPPIDVPGTQPDWTQKEQIILGVGRFFASGHSKRQDLMVRIFRELCDAGLTGWRLHLVGGLQCDHQEDVAFYKRVVELSRGYPVDVQADAPGEALTDLYRRAAIYWHAAGFGVDTESRPEDAEHFGMTTVEAMGYGAVPVAVARGGQTEVVEDGVSGFLWDDLEQWKTRTLELVARPGLRRRLGEAARTRSSRFDRASFKRGIVDAISPLLEDLGVKVVPDVRPSRCPSSPPVR